MRRRLIVNWNGGDSTSIVPVAELLHDDKRKDSAYEFGYLQGASQARGLGFQVFPAFPDIGRRYASDELFPFFHNRVLPTTRPDYFDYVQALGLDPANASYVDLLGRSNARRATDRIEMVLVPERDEHGNYATYFFVRGVRYQPGAETITLGLTAGDRLACVLESTNRTNPRARLLTSGGSAIGHLPDYLVADVDELERLGSEPTVTVVRVNPPPLPMHHRVLCRLEATWPLGFVPFRDPRLAPYAGSTNEGPVARVG